jgi:hypothetical protein
LNGALSVDQIVDGFGLEEVKLSIQKSSFGKLTRLSFSKPIETTQRFK